MPADILQESGLGLSSSASKEIKFHRSLHSSVDEAMLGARLILKYPFISH